MNYEHKKLKLLIFFYSAILVISATMCAFSFRVLLDKTKAELKEEQENNAKVLIEMTRQNDILEKGLKDVEQR
jgi:hypothetical protein